MDFNTIYQLIFYTFSAILLFSAVMVVASRHAVRAVLFLVLAFFSSAVLWMLLQAEFLSLVLIFVYVGAVMTLFLFVVMMLNLETAQRPKNWVRYLPLGALIVGLLVFLTLRVIHQDIFAHPLIMQPAQYNNTQQLGSVLYTDYVYPFELAAILLLIAIIAAIALTFRGSRNRKSQQISRQLNVQRAHRIQLIKDEKK